MRNQIPIEVKSKCCDMWKCGTPIRDVYDFFKKSVPGSESSYRTFKSLINRWSKKVYPDDTTLRSGTYEGFTAHGATVQVAANGEIVQAWIKQHSDEFGPEEFLEAVKESVKPYQYQFEVHSDSNDMLEISLFDMHWGIAFLDYYKRVLDEILNIIYSHHWKRIVIPFGQDFFHNDSIVKGETTKGTKIEKVDMVRAVKEGQKFIYAIIDAAISQSENVNILYSPGNHDKSISWMFIQVLMERYGSLIVDDTIQTKKVISYGKNAIMVMHGDSKRAVPKNLAHIFPTYFPDEFSKSTTREVHAGHLHAESDSDIFGIMVRRLSSGNKNDTWSDDEDYVGTHKRFMIFDWSLEKLKAIYYI